MTNILKKQIKRLEEKQSSFRDFVKIHLKHIRFNDLNERKVETDFHLNTKNVARLVKIFEIQECLRLNIEHYISTIIDEQILQDSIKTFELKSSEDLLNRRISFMLQLSSTLNLHCLHNKHRIAVAKKFLFLDDKWWVVNFYSNPQYYFSMRFASIRLTITRS